MKINRDEYRRKTLGCWLGKNIGGTLGEPFEWLRQINDISFYRQDLQGEPRPNDDLDIQLLWLIALEEKGIAIDAQLLAEYWCMYVTPHWGEYGTAKINMRSGLVPPLSGSFRNIYKHSCGAFIRSEIWACIAPGMPRIAAKYALEDAILDHGDGEGTYAEVFVAALESAAFIVADIEKLIDIGLSYIPQDCGVAAAIATVRAAHGSGADWVEARDEILTRHRGSCFMHDLSTISARDIEKGFESGEQGYDVPSNIGILVLGLLYGGTDFDRMMSITVNCGEDTDCTAATAGSIYGIIHGADAIPERWVAPIGRGIKTACLNLGELGHFGDQLPQDVDELTDRTERIARSVLLRHTGADFGTESAADDVKAELSADRAFQNSLYRGVRGPVYRFDFFTVAIDYGLEPTIVPGVAKRIRITVDNEYRVQTNLSFRWLFPAGVEISPSQTGSALSMPPWLGKPVEFAVDVFMATVETSAVRGSLVIWAEGRPLAMTVPIVFMNGSLDAQLPSEPVGLPAEQSAGLER